MHDLAKTKQMQGLPSKKDNLESDHELDHGLCEKKKKKRMIGKKTFVAVLIWVCGWKSL